MGFMSITEFYSAPLLKSNPRKLIKLVFCPYVNKLVVGGGDALQCTQEEAD